MKYQKKEANQVRETPKQIESEGMNEEEIEWCPTRSGTFTAYDVEHKVGNKWELVGLRSNKLQIPYPAYEGGVIESLALLGKAQAEAARWLYEAQAAAEGKSVKTRLVKYKVVYDLKACRV